MRVAVCLSGFVRGMEICLPSWDKFLISTNPDHTFEFFGCFGPSQEYNNNASNAVLLSKFSSHFNVITMETAPSIDPPFPNILELKNYNKRSISHVLSMFDKITRANQLKSNYENDHGFKYDMVMRFRPDIFLRSDIILDDNTKLHVPKHGDFGGLNDQLAWSSSKNMDHYCSLSKHIIEYLETTNLTLNPEYLTQKQWEKSEVPLQRPNVLYQLARDNSNMLPDNETRERIQRESNGTRNL